jgi:endonuclease-3
LSNTIVFKNPSLPSNIVSLPVNPFFAKYADNVFEVEKKLMKKLPKDKWSRTHHQLVLFGRYICKSQNPNCDKCLLKEVCKYYKNLEKN